MLILAMHHATKRIKRGLRKRAILGYLTFPENDESDAIARYPGDESGVRVGRKSQGGSVFDPGEMAYAKIDFHR